MTGDGFGSKLASRRRRIMKFILIFFVLLLVSIGIYWFFFVRNDTQTAQQLEKFFTKEVCNDEMVIRATNNMTERDSLSLYTLTTEIDKDPDFDKDPDCLFIKLKYNFLNNIAQGNDALVESLQVSYDNGYVPSNLFGTERMTLKDIKSTVETLRSIEELYNMQQKVEQESFNADSVIGTEGLNE